MPMFSVSLFVLLVGGSVALPAPVRAVAANVMHAGVSVGTAAYMANARSADLAGPAGIYAPLAVPPPPRRP